MPQCLSLVCIFRAHLVQSAFSFLLCAVFPEDQLQVLCAFSFILLKWITEGPIGHMMIYHRFYSTDLTSSPSLNWLARNLFTLRLEALDKPLVKIFTLVTSKGHGSGITWRTVIAVRDCDTANSLNNICSNWKRTTCSVNLFADYSSYSRLKTGQCYNANYNQSNNITLYHIIYHHTSSLNTSDSVKH